MTAIEQSLPLSEVERETLSRGRRRAMILAPIGAIISGLFLLVTVALVLAQAISLFLVALLLFSFVTGVNALMNLLKFIKFQRDLREGQKRLINAPVEAQDIDISSGGKYSSASYDFWVKAGGRKLSITEQQYYQIKKGDLIQAYVAPHSGTVLGISQSMEAAT